MYLSQVIHPQCMYLMYNTIYTTLLQNSCCLRVLLRNWCLHAYMYMYVGFNLIYMYMYTIHTCDNSSHNGEREGQTFKTSKTQLLSWLDGYMYEEP